MTGDLIVGIASVAECLQFLIAHPSNPGAGEFESRINSIKTSLQELPFPHTFATARELEEFQASILRKYQATSALSNQHETELRSIAQTLIRSLHHEIQQKQIIFLNPAAVVQSLVDLPKALPYLTETQHMLREEVVRCLQVESYRSAIVMAWSFAYDYVRKWIFTEHRDSFNQALQSGYQRNGQPIYLQVVRYEDFWERKPALGEWVVLETCERAAIIVGKQYDSLAEHLRMRNDYAHPNFNTPSADLTKGYIAALLQTITSPPFPKPSHSLQ